VSHRPFEHLGDPAGDLGPYRGLDTLGGKRRVDDLEHESRTIGRKTVESEVCRIEALEDRRPHLVNCARHESNSRETRATSSVDASSASV
jgi:hypothetical protein